MLQVTSITVPSFGCK